MVALHAEVMNSNAKAPQNVMTAQADIIARLTQSIYGGAKVLYDDKANTIEMRKYGVFWKAKKNFLIGVEYNQVGDL